MMIFYAVACWTYVTSARSEKERTDACKHVADQFHDRPHASFDSYALFPSQAKESCVAPGIRSTESCAFSRRNLR